MNEARKCVVVAYASEDHKVSTDTFQGLGRTTIIQSDRGLVVEPGAAFFFARALHRRKVPTAVISWLANDEAARRYASSLQDLGAETTGLSFRGSRSPSTYMFYTRDGEVVSFYDPGDVSTEATDTQRAEAKHASAVIFGVAPPEAVLDLITNVPKGAWVTWAVKADPASVTQEVAIALADRADAICFSEDEQSFLTVDRGLDLDALSRKGTVIVVTKGADGAQYSVNGLRLNVPARIRVDSSDPTGAGDTFAAGLTAALAFPSDQTGTRCSTQAQVERAVLLAESDATDLIIERKRKHDVHQF